MGKSKTGQMSRRDFARSAALAAASVAALRANAFAQAEAPTASQPAPQQSEEPKLSPESRAEVETKVQNIFRKHGQRLSEEQKTDIRRLVAEGQKSLDSLRAFPLENADEPATVLKLFPETQLGQRSKAAPRHTSH